MENHGAPAKEIQAKKDEVGGGVVQSWEKVRCPSENLGKPDI